MTGSITDVAGVRVGHWTDEGGATGCTVVLSESGAVAAVEVRGSAPGTRETDRLHPETGRQVAHGVLLTGGSAFGLAAAGGVMRFLEERGAGLELGPVKVPIVPAAVLFDLAVGSVQARPRAEAGYAACRRASDGPVEEGCVGAGTGASVGKLFGPKLATKAGLGSASVRTGEGFVVGALVAVNAFGDVVSPFGPEVLAGTRWPVGRRFLNTGRHMGGWLGQFLLRFASASNTTLAVVATDARLTGEEVQKLAEVAHDGLALTIRPIHTMWDGDTAFALATGQAGKHPRDINPLLVSCVEATAMAVLRAVEQATPLAGLPAARDLGRGDSVRQALSRLGASRRRTTGAAVAETGPRHREGR